MITQSLSAACASAAVLTLFVGAAASGDEGGFSPDDHAPAGVMFDHLHDKGEWMVGYRYSREEAGPGMLHGSESASDMDIVNGGACGTHPCAMTVSGMQMDMHMLDLMWAPTDRLTLMLMPMWMSHEMEMRPLDAPMDMDDMDEHSEHGGGHAGPHSHGTEGLGDTLLGALVGLGEGEGWRLHAGAFVSAPTGAVDEKNPDGTFTHYHMQLGSGTWDFVPSLTYAAQRGRWSLGVQASGVVRLESENDSGYRLGNVFQATSWAGVRLNDMVSASFRVEHMRQGDIEGHYNGPHNHSSPVDLQPNYGGQFWDAGVGLNLVVPSGPLAGHRLGVEWLEPLDDHVNGFQAEREGTLQLVWSKAF